MLVRPPTVPPDAVWSESDGEWVLAPKNSAGQHHGWVKYYRPDGTLACITQHHNGVPNGFFTRYHENGEVSREGFLQNGKLHGKSVFRRSSGPTTEKFGPFPPSVRRSDVEYSDGAVIAVKLYDADGRQCRDDGEPFPELRPEGVAPDAYFGKSDGEYRWVHGQFRVVKEGEHARDGRWRFWSPEGRLVTEEQYLDGKLHGTCRHFDEDTGECLDERHYEHGELVDLAARVVANAASTPAPARDEPTWHAIANDDDYLDDEEQSNLDGTPASQRAAWCQGEFDDDDPRGPITYFDATRTRLVTIDTGVATAPDDISPLLELHDSLASAATMLRTEGKLGAAVFALARAVGRGEAPASKLAELLTALAPPISIARAKHVAQRHNYVVEQMKRFGASPAQAVGHLLEGIRQGGYPTDLLRAIAADLDDMNHTSLAAEVIEATLAVAHPTDAASYQSTHALILASLGRRDEAYQAIEEYAKAHSRQAQGLGHYLNALFPTWDFLDLNELDDVHARLAPMLTRVKAKHDPDVNALRMAIMKAATRIMAYRGRLVEAFGECAWLPPPLDRLLPDGPVPVEVSSTMHGIGLMHEVRREWQRLCWLCYLAGLSKIELPRIIGSPLYVPAYLFAVARYVAAFERGTDALLGCLPDDWDVIAPGQAQRLAEASLRCAHESSWHGMPLAEAGGAPDTSFIIEDLNAALSAFQLFNNPTVDIFATDDDDAADDESEDADADADADEREAEALADDQAVTGPAAATDEEVIALVAAKPVAATGAAHTNDYVQTSGQSPDAATTATWAPADEAAATAAWAATDMADPAHADQADTPAELAADKPTAPAPLVDTWADAAMHVSVPAPHDEGSAHSGSSPTRLGLDANDDAGLMPSDDAGLIPIDDAGLIPVDLSPAFDNRDLAPANANDDSMNEDDDALELAPAAATDYDAATSAIDTAAMFAVPAADDADEPDAADGRDPTLTNVGDGSHARAATMLDAADAGPLDDATALRVAQAIASWDDDEEPGAPGDANSSATPPALSDATAAVDLGAIWDDGTGSRTQAEDES